jgi:hypothetical protein
MREGWSRIAAQAILLGLPCILADHAGPGDLRRLTQQRVPDLAHLADQIRHRARTSTADTDAARHALAQFDQRYFNDAWRSLLDGVCPPPTPTVLQDCD